MSEDESETWGLVMPFVVCASQGGPFADEAFVVGYECGGIDKTLQVLAAAGGSGARFTATVHTSGVPQLDLIAMQHGFKLTTDTVENPADHEPMPDWTYATFEPE